MKSRTKTGVYISLAAMMMVTTLGGLPAAAHHVPFKGTF